MGRQAAEVLRSRSSRGVVGPDILDFRVPVSPLGPSKKVKAEMRKHLRHLDRHPDGECVRLRRRIGETTGVDPASVLCTAGFSGALRALISALEPASVLLAAPGAPGHRAAIEGMAIEIVTLQGLSAGKLPSSLPGQSLFLLGNPDFPSGMTWNRESVLAFAARAAESKSVVVVDESFAEFCPEHSLLPVVEQENNVVLIRSLGPFHGLAGLRVGFIASRPDLLAEFRRFHDPLSVNSLAQRAAFVALGDRAFIKDTTAWCRNERRYLSKEFTAMGCSVEASPANFLTIGHEAAQALYDHLSRRKILVGFQGAAAERDGFIYFAFRSHKDNARLVRECRHFLGRRGRPAPAAQDGASA